MTYHKEGPLAEEISLLILQVAKRICEYPLDGNYEIQKLQIRYGFCCQLFSATMIWKPASVPSAAISKIQQHQNFPLLPEKIKRLCQLLRIKS
ncbi:MAG: hypothetical protein ACLTSZ_01740 [Lachnospiraceae bacterium]